MTITPAELVFINETRETLPRGFYEDASTDQLQFFIELVIADINVFPPATTHTLLSVSQTGNRLAPIVKFGVNVFAQLFWQMKASLQDFTYSDQGLSVNVNQVEKIGQSYRNMLELYRLQIVNYKKTEISSMLGKGASLISPRYQCLGSDTTILLLDGKIETIGELYKQEAKNIKLYSVSPLGLIVPATALEVRLTRPNTELVLVNLDNGNNFKCTPDHKVMMRDGSYIEAKDLKENDSVMCIDTKDKRELVNCNIKSIKELEEKEDTFDLIESLPYHNFVLGCGICVKNSSLSQFISIVMGRAWTS